MSLFFLLLLILSYFLDASKNLWPKSYPPRLEDLSSSDFLGCLQGVSSFLACLLLVVEDLLMNNILVHVLDDVRDNGGPKPD